MFDGVQHARCEEISVSISFLQNTSQSCCSSLLQNFTAFKGNGNRFDLHGKHFMIISISEIGVSMEFNMLGVKITA